MNSPAPIAARPHTLAISPAGLFAVTVWGASFVATRHALEAFTPVGLVALRLWAGVALLAAVQGFRRAPLFPERADRPAGVFLGVVLAAHLLLQAWGLRYTTAGHTGWIIGFLPVSIALGAHLVGQQRIGRRGWAGVGLGTAGVLLVMGWTPAGFAHARFGDLLQLISCVTWTVYTLAAAGPVARSGVLRMTTFGMFIAAVLTSVATAGTGLLAAERWADAPPWTGILVVERWADVSTAALVALAFLGPVCSGVAYYMWFAAQRAYGPAHVAALLYVEPFVALATGVLLKGERVGANAVIGGICVLIGVWLVTRAAAPRVQSRETSASGGGSGA